jgi:hypothetical protein
MTKKEVNKSKTGWKKLKGTPEEVRKQVTEYVDSCMKKKGKAGRPTKEQAIKKKKLEVNKRRAEANTKMCPEVIAKLEFAFSLGASQLEACLNAGISRSAYYEWLKKNPDRKDKFEQLRETPTYKARKTVVDALEENPELALKYLERKKKDEFSLRQENVNTNIDADVMLSDEDEKLLVDDIKKKYNLVEKK